MANRLREDMNWPMDYAKIVAPVPESDDRFKIIKDAIHNIILTLLDMWRELTEKVHYHDEHADATLSGTAKVFEIKDDDGTVYYFKSYPNKT